MPDEHPVSTEAPFGEKRVRTGEGRRGVLVAGQAKPARSPQHRRPWLACCGEVVGVATFCTLQINPRTLDRLLVFAGIGLDLHRRELAGFPELTAFPGRFHQCRGVELLPITHSARPRDTDDERDGANGSSSSSIARAGRRPGVRLAA